jgi:hypothetical protein
VCKYLFETLLVILVSILLHVLLTQTQFLFDMIVDHQLVHTCLGEVVKTLKKDYSSNVLESLSW